MHTVEPTDSIYFVHNAGFTKTEKQSAKCLHRCYVVLLIHSFILIIYIAPLQETYSEELSALAYYDVKCHYERKYYIS